MLAVLAAAMVIATDRPIIGIWAHPSTSTSPGCRGMCEYIAASYVKWVEGAGGRAIAIPYNADNATMDGIFESVNGILLPGGSAELPKSAKRIFPKIVEANKNGEAFPLWGTCLGFEWLMQLASNDDHILSSGYDSENISLALQLTSDAGSSRMLGGATPYGDSIRDILSNTTNPPTMNNHQQGISPDVFNKTPQLTSFFTMLSTNVDRKGVPFVSQVEAKTVSVFGTQWHPEKNNYEWGVNPQDEALPLEAINHSPAAIKGSQAMADFFLTEARKNNRRYADPQKEYDSLIWNTGTLDTYQTEGFSQVYYFHF
eukprot:TRINITY_DN17351_c0_g1_i1.p1 TRINITY_DN17351_c0_g1~~TRINITY_DN17351_c0_g1_i1.p1  ORF type:complete len:314 (+),score=55.03 TRINITY_DN17351_c0_g1_i1:73-1014(+)